MPFLVYAAILVVTVFSVALEWDALVVPSAATQHAMHAISQLPPAHPSPPGAAPAERVVHAAPPAPAAPANPAPAPAAEPPPAAPEQAAAAAPPQCDVAACAAAYGSFRASDCTWQPYDGPRRLCTKGSADDAAATNADANAPGPARCHLRACAEAYSSFNPSDCTYQPFDGPRRLCEK